MYPDIQSLFLTAAAAGKFNSLLQPPTFFFKLVLLLKLFMMFRNAQKSKLSSYIFWALCFLFLPEDDNFCIELDINPDTSEIPDAGGNFVLLSLTLF